MLKSTKPTYLVPDYNKNSTHLDYGFHKRQNEKTVQKSNKKVLLHVLKQNLK